MNLELTPSVLLDQLTTLLPKAVSAKNNSINKILVAYSGGLDSHVLLHLFSRISRADVELRAIYVNHGLQDEATDWDKHCESICQNLKIPYSCINLNLTVAKGESLEEVARTARYDALFEQLVDGEILVTGHHQNDQAETLLLQLFRGAGVQGLAAMPVINEFMVNDSSHHHYRPLLSYSRNTLESYAVEHGLEHIEDLSNKDTAFDRNFLRQDIMPLLRNRWLGIDKTIARAASIQAETKSLLDDLAAEKLPLVLSDCIDADTDENDVILAPIDIGKLRDQNKSTQTLLLRYWISQQGFISPSDKKLHHIFIDLIDAADDKQPLITWSGVELRRYQHKLYIMQALSQHDDKQVIPWKGDQPLEIVSLRLTLDKREIHSKGFNNIQNLTVRFRQGGEKIELPKRGNISLKNLFQECQVPPWMRSRLPLIYQGDDLIQIIGLELYKTHPPTFQ